MHGARDCVSQSRAPVQGGGVLLDVSPAARAFGILCPVHLTEGAWAAAVGSVSSDEQPARVRLLLWAYLVAAAADGQDETLFNVRSGSGLTSLKAVSGRGGATGSAIIVMLPGEGR